MSKKVAVTEMTLAEKANDVAYRMAAGRTLLRAQLVDGVNTAAVRAELAALETEAAALKSQIDERDRAAEGVTEAALAARASTLAAASATRLTALLASLAAPQAPWTAR